MGDSEGTLMFLEVTGGDLPPVKSLLFISCSGGQTAEVSLKQRPLPYTLQNHPREPAHPGVSLQPQAGAGACGTCQGQAGQTSDTPT